MKVPRARAGNWLGAVGQGNTADTARPRDPMNEGNLLTVLHVP